LAAVVAVVAEVAGVAAGKVAAMGADAIKI
jgi:hypothetical protein